jgi:hypothetical protein
MMTRSAPVITNLSRTTPIPSIPAPPSGFSLPQAQQVKLDVYNIKGQKVSLRLPTADSMPVFTTLPGMQPVLAAESILARISTSEGYSKTIKMMIMK